MTAAQATAARTATTTAGTMEPGLRTRLTERYGLASPITQAGMAFAGMTPPLGIAISEAGAMGSIAGVGILPPEVVRMLVQGVRAGTAKPFHVNFITPYCTDAHVDLMVEMRPAAVSFHWGAVPERWIASLKGAGIDVWEQVGTLEAARLAADNGVDVVIAQGVEAGGHNFAEAGTMAIVPAVVDAMGSRALVLASGGIADGRGIAAALALGADGAWLGTRFVATREAAVADEYKARMIAATTGDTALTHVFGRHHPEFNPIRVLRNRVVGEWSERIGEIPADTTDREPVGRMEMMGQETPLHPHTNLVPMPGATGDFEELPLLAGQGVGLVRDLPGAGEVVARLVRETREALARAAR